MRERGFADIGCEIEEKRFTPCQQLLSVSQCFIYCLCRCHGALDAAHHLEVAAALLMANGDASNDRRCYRKKYYIAGRATGADRYGIFMK